VRADVQEPDQRHTAPGERALDSEAHIHQRRWCCAQKAVELTSGDLSPSVLQRLEGWTRRRLRSVIWKQWKRGSVRFVELRKRGVGRDLAAPTVGSAHGPWRLANSPALAFALPNAYFDSLGIPRFTGGR